MIRVSIFTILLVAGCAPDITETDFFRRHPSDMDFEPASVELGVIRDGHLTINVTAPDSLRMGTSVIRMEAIEDGSPVSGASFSVLPRWVGGARIISSPLGAVKFTPTDRSGHFEGAPIFVSPHSEQGHWQLQITYATAGTSGEAILPIEIQPSIWVQYTGRYYISWVQPVRPITGLDEIEFALHRLVGDSFVSLEDARIDLYPWMNMGADQGHSTPYEAPVHTSNGRYKGSVNFIMSGGWDMTVFIQHTDMARDTVKFNGFIVY